ncbi:hypothetical protein NST58_01770 [Paenibacillus sp. FSL R10-2796]
MLVPIELLESQISRTEHQLLMHLINEQKETNTLLQQLVKQQTAKPKGGK